MAAAQPDSERFWLWSGPGLTAAGMALAGATLIGVALAGAQVGSPTALPDRSLPTTSTRTTPTPGAAGEQPRESVPTRVTIPAIGVDAGTVELGLDGAAMQTPADPDLVGWFHGAHTPGGPGVAVLAGHVTWDGRRTVFADLGHLPLGARIAVDRVDGSTVSFEVRRVATFPKDRFPTHEVYAAGDQPKLILITCGGDYDLSRHYYDSNVIAWADAV